MNHKLAMCIYLSCDLDVDWLCGGLAQYGRSNGRQCYCFSEGVLAIERRMFWNCRRNLEPNSVLRPMETSLKVNDKQTKKSHAPCT